MKRYAVVIELGKRNHSAWVPDMPGCVSVGVGLPEMRRMIREAIEFHIWGIRDDGDREPEPSATCASVDVGRRYAVLVERKHRGFVAHATDLPDCVAAARTRPGAVRLLRDVLRSHLEDLRWARRPPPEPATRCEMVGVRPGHTSSPVVHRPHPGGWSGRSVPRRGEAATVPARHRRVSVPA